MIDVPAESLSLIRAIFKKHIPDCEVRVFGSRTLGTAKPYSDLDVALVARRPIPSEILSALKEEFSESDIPFRVDLLEWQTLSPEFRAVIERHYEILAKA